MNYLDFGKQLMNKASCLSKSGAFLILVLVASLAADFKAIDAADPSKAMVGVYFNSIREIDWEAGIFKADIYWWIRHPVSMPDEVKKVVERIEFVNVNLDTVVQEELDRMEINVDNELQNLIIYRVVGDFHFSTDFSRYPFDEQTVSISLEHKSLSSEQFLFEVDWLSYRRFEGSHAFPGISPSLRIPDFVVAGVDFDVIGKRYATDFGDLSADVQAGSTFSNVSVGIRFQRQFLPYLFKILVPVVICLILPYMVFFLPGAELEVAVGLTVTSLLTCVAIQLTVVPGLPSIGYVATSDLIFYLSYLLAMLAMAQTVWTYNLGRQGREDLASKMDYLFRWCYPLFFVLGMILIFLR